MTYITINVWDESIQRFTSEIKVPYDWLRENPDIIQPSEFDYFVW